MKTISTMFLAGLLVLIGLAVARAGEPRRSSAPKYQSLQDRFNPGPVLERTPPELPAAPRAPEAPAVKAEPAKTEPEPEPAPEPEAAEPAEPSAQPDLPTLIPDPEVDVSAVLRRGNMVQEMGVIRAGPEEAVGEALAPPPDDSHKWFIRVITQDGCPSCEALKHHFLTTAALTAWVNVNDPARSFAHYQVYRWEDRTQAAKWSEISKQIKIEKFPVVLLQPPANGKFGPSRVVVYMSQGYDGDAETLAGNFRTAIDQYVKSRWYEGQQDDWDVYEVSEPAPASAATPIGAPPSAENPAGGPGEAPFPVGPKVLDPRYPSEPEQNIPPVPRRPSVAELKRTLPEAPEGFLLQALEQRWSLEQAAAEWEKVRPRPASRKELATELPEAPRDFLYDCLDAQLTLEEAVAAWDEVLASQEEPENAEAATPGRIEIDPLVVALLLIGLGIVAAVIYLRRQRPLASPPARPVGGGSGTGSATVTVATPSSTTEKEALNEILNELREIARKETAVASSRG